MREEKWDDKYLNFSKQATNGVLFFLFVFLLFVLLPRLKDVLISPEKKKVTISYFNVEVEEDNEKQNENQFSFNLPNQSFDPNELSQQDWMDIGLSEKQSTSLLKYKYAIGGFKNADDFSKAYAINEDLFEAIVDLLIFPKQEEVEPKKQLPKEKSTKKRIQYEKTDVREEKFVLTNEVFNINTAQEEDFVKIKGIGPYFAEKIISTRNDFGGFVDLDQVLAINNWSDVTIEQINKHFVIDKSNVQKLNINVLSVYELKKHPYIDWNVAQSIVELRKDLTYFRSTDEVIKSVFVDLQLYRKLEPYLTIE